MLEKIDPANHQLQGLVIAPTRELAIQTQEELYRLGKDKNPGSSGLRWCGYWSSNPSTKRSSPYRCRYTRTYVRPYQPPHIEILAQWKHLFWMKQTKC